MRLRVQDLAKQKGINISQMQRRADITMGTARRYWYGTRNGKVEGPPLDELNLSVLNAIANVLGVTVSDLLSEGNRSPLQLAAA